MNEIDIVRVGRTSNEVFLSLFQIELPMWARKPILSWYVKRFGCDLGEACQEDVTKYSR